MVDQFDEGDRFRRMLGNVEDPAPILKQVGALMQSESQAAFKAQKHGKKGWSGRTVPNVYGIIADLHGTASVPPKRRFEPRPALRDTGRLGSTIAFELIGKKAVEVGSNLPYAGVHNEGGPIESLPINETVQEKLGKWLKGPGKIWKSSLGFLLNKKFTNQTLKGTVEARPFVGLTKQSIADINEVVRFTLFGDQ